MTPRTGADMAPIELRRSWGGKGHPMLSYALIFLLVGLVAGALGLLGVAAVATQIAWLLFLVGIVLIVVHMVTGRHGPRTL